LLKAWDRVLASGLAILLTVVAAIAQSDTAAVIDFDIGAQSVATALDAYSGATGLVAVYDGELAVGPQSRGRRGRYAREAALQLLLSNSGLVAQFTTTGAFVLLRAQSRATDVGTPSMIGLAALAKQNAVEQQYSGLMQSSINQALCGVPETR